jgi:hypothetical protein
MSFFNFPEEVFLEQNDPLSTLKSRICRRKSFHKLPQLQKGIKVLDPIASTTGGILSRTHVFPQLSWIFLFGTKWSFLHLETHVLQEIYLSKPTQYSQENPVLKAHASTTTVIPSRDICVSSPQWIGLLGTKLSFVYLENEYLWEVHLSQVNSILTGKQCATCSCF